MQRSCGVIRATTEVDEEVVVEEGFVLSRDEAHLGVKLRRLLPHVLRSHCQFRPTEYHGLAEDSTALRSTERENVDASIERHRAQSGR